VTYLVPASISLLVGSELAMALIPDYYFRSVPMAAREAHSLPDIGSTRAPFFDGASRPKRGGM